MFQTNSSPSISSSDLARSPNWPGASYILQRNQRAKFVRLACSFSVGAGLAATGLATRTSILFGESTAWNGPVIVTSRHKGRLTGYYNCKGIILRRLADVKNFVLPSWHRYLPNLPKPPRNAPSDRARYAVRDSDNAVCGLRNSRWPHCRHSNICC